MLPDRGIHDIRFLPSPIAKLAIISGSIFVYTVYFLFVNTATLFDDFSLADRFKGHHIDKARESVTSVYVITSNNEFMCSVIRDQKINHVGLPVPT